MIRLHREPDVGACPFIDLDDKRCAAHFTLAQLDIAFSVCLRKPHCCSTFHELRNEAEEQERREQGREPTQVLRRTGS